jgi:hypothetical protein
MRRLTFLILMAAVAAGCPDSDDPQLIDAPSDGGIDAHGFSTTIPAEVNRNVDLLFVVDNSGSMLAEQQQLTANFPSFINTLQQVTGGLPDLHLGIVSSNVGAAGAASVPGCPLSGDDGNLLTGPPNNTCATQFGLQGSFISDLAQPNGTRLRNYTGDLSQLFACMASLGTSGCGFEQHLESMFRALQPGKNPGFFRPDAHLALIFLADEDDCSTEMGTMFGDPNAGLQSELGPRTSFRCHEFGVECDNDPNPRSFGPKTGCRPRANSQFMFEVQRYIDFVSNLKSGGAQVIVGGIIGNFDATTGDLTVGPDPNNPMFPAVQKSCFVNDPNDPDDGASPPVRLQSFLSAFPGRNSVTTICNSNLQDALVEIGVQVKNAMGNPCIDADLLDSNPQLDGLQPSCTANDIVGATRVPLPQCATLIQAGVSTCDPGSVGTPCWCIISNPVTCPNAPNGFSISINRGGAVPPLGTLTEVFCETP